jgi:monofunctional biosynthetic peptidoglycan transglycosylase
MKKLLLAFGILLFCLVAYQFAILPDVSILKRENPQLTALMRQREREAGGKKVRRYQIWVPQSAISSHLKTAVLIGEDGAFYQHQGYDLEEIKQSFLKNWEKGSFIRGGSTITQQLAKNLYLSTSRNPLRKLNEFLIARRIEEELTKRRILEIYLNVIEWGQGIYGAEAASRTYFNSSAKELGIREAVLLAAMIPNPRRMTPSRVSGQLRYRFQMILARMHQYHHISSEEYELAMNSGDPTP